MYKDFENSVAIITGAASGLGLAIAKKLSQLKVKLVLFDSDKASALKIKTEFQEEVKLYTVDVTLEDEVKKAMMKLQISLVLLTFWLTVQGSPEKRILKAMRLNMLI